MGAVDHIVLTDSCQDRQEVKGRIDERMHQSKPFQLCQFLTPQFGDFMTKEGLVGVQLDCSDVVNDLGKEAYSLIDNLFLGATIRHEFAK